MGRTAPLEQGTSQQMGGRSCLLYNSVIVTNDHYILLGEKDNLEASITLYYENTWLRPALAIPCPAVVSCDMKKMKARESNHQKSSPTPS